MSKRNKRPVSLGAAVVMSVVVSIVVATVYVLVSLAIPNSPETLLVQLVAGNESSALSSGLLYQNLWSQVFTQQMFIQMPLSMLAGGVALGWRLGEEFGVRKLYTWAAYCGIFIFVASNCFLWMGKLVNQGMHLNPGDVTSQLVIANIFAFILWVGLYVCGSDIGRRFHKTRTPRTATA
jgi:hypothetical protein